ncbi:hypothetical protein NW754_014577 [Fusarium falciforme]|nr:hypothetical protein NW754_014577 [Fusarium falciforme]KAJ4182441.1 hypothetical protein NW767_013859 [Fusarium falciforme]KAJ4231805.1 hypothetical protein NW757_013912 [Fusarium falciforme]
MSYQKRILATGTVFNPEENGVWTFADFNGDGSPDLVYIKTRSTGTGKIEVHASRNESRFQEHNLATGTAFNVEDNGTWLMHDWTRDGKADLVYIKTRNTGTGMVEVHVADAASNYQRFVLQTGTCFGCEDDGIWTMSEKGDLVYIKTRNCGSNKIEYHVASKASNYQQFTQHAVTDFPLDNNGTYCLAPKCDGDFADLYYIKTRNTGSDKTEVHAVSSKSGWKKRVVDVDTGFGAEENGTWLMAHFTHQRLPDLVFIKTRSTGTGKIEAHVNEPKEYITGSFMNSCRRLRLDSGAILQADLQRNDGTWRDAAIDLSMVLGNMEGRLTWSKKGFSQSARGIRLEGSVVFAELHKSNGEWAPDSFDLQNRIVNNDGAFQALEVPIILAIPKDQEAAAMKQLGEAFKQPDFKLQAVEEKDGSTIFYGNASVGSQGVIFKTYSAEARASVMHLAKSNGKPIEQVNVDVFTAGVGVIGGSYLGAEANVSLFKAEASIFDLNLGVGVDTGVGIKDDSLDLHLAGCGIQIGRKVSISAFGSSFGIDFGRLFG